MRLRNDGNLSHRALLCSLLVVIVLSSSNSIAIADSSPTTEEAAPLDDSLQNSLEEYDPLFDDDEGALNQGFPDPIEPVNRGVFSVNTQIDRYVIEPITRGYRYIVPDAARRSIRNFLWNLDSAPVLLNDLFQLEWKDAAVTTSRLVINTTIGVAGFFDPATKWGIERHESDFGQTLTLAGVGSGPYLVIPLLGPMNIRDGAGQVVDAFLRPTTYLLGPSQLMFYGGTAGLVTREEHEAGLAALRESSVDFYAAMRSAYYQNRIAQIWSRREHRR
jgi:phospholipid-binding lipoprotein MlaA